MVCDQKTCNKKYHKECVEIDDADTRFSCPWHHCTECDRRTSAHCSFCSVAFCQGSTFTSASEQRDTSCTINVSPLPTVHLDGNLFEYDGKSGFVCRLHENTEDVKDYSDNDVETDKEYSSTGSSSPLAMMEKAVPREPSPRVSIVEVR